MATLNPCPIFSRHLTLVGNVENHGQLLPSQVIHFLIQACDELELATVIPGTHSF